jgi:hypothetical protein
MLTRARAMRRSAALGLGLGLGLFSLLVAGCKSFPDAVRVRAAGDLHCPVENITLAPTQPYQLQEAYRARGCGQTLDYEGGCGLVACTIQFVPSPAEQLEIQRQAQAVNEERRRSTPHASAPSGSGSGGGAQIVSLSLHNDCPRTVRLFFGNTPKFGSGTESSISSNSTESRSMREGEMIWIVDEAGNGMSSLTVSPGQTHVTITRSCAGFAPY